MKRLSVVLFLLAMIAAVPVSACERCRYYIDYVTCWSGFAKGSQWCYGGYGDPCQEGDACSSAAVAPSDVTPAESVCADGVLGCTDAQPAGFALEQPAKTVAAKRPAIREAS